MSEKVAHFEIYVPMLANRETYLYGLGVLLILKYNFFKKTEYYNLKIIGL